MTSGSTVPVVSGSTVPVSGSTVPVTIGSTMPVVSGSTVPVSGSGNASVAAPAALVPASAEDATTSVAGSTAATGPATGWRVPAAGSAAPAGEPRASVAGSATSAPSSTAGTPERGSATSAPLQRPERPREARSPRRGAWKGDQTPVSPRSEAPGSKRCRSLCRPSIHQFRQLRSRRTKPHLGQQPCLRTPRRLILARAGRRTIPERAPPCRSPGPIPLRWAQRQIDLPPARIRCRPQAGAGAAGAGAAGGSGAGAAGSAGTALAADSWAS